jgi:cytoskeleton protein RodZ
MTVTEEVQGAVEVETDASYLSFLPGERLHKARELRGLSIAQVAQELRLSERYVRAMEADDYSSLPESAFVRGYMRRYAQLVKLSPDDIVARFDESLTGSRADELRAEKRRNPLQLLGELSQRRVRWPQLLGWLSAAFIVLLLLGGLFWRAGASRPNVQGSTDTPMTSAPAMAPAVTAPVIMPLSPAASGVLPAPAAASTDVLPSPAGSSVVALPAPVAAPAAPAAASGR